MFEEESIWRVLWEYISEKYFSVELGTYENFTIETGGLISISGIIVGLTLGMIVAAGMTVYDKKHLGGFVRKLISEECFDRESAQTLYDLGYYRSPGVRGSLKRGTVFARWVRCVEEDEYLEEIEKKRAEFETAHENDAKRPRFKAPEFKRDCNTMHFYLPEDKRIGAEIKFSSRGANWFVFAIVAVIAIALCIVICRMLPDLLQLVDNFIGLMNGSENNMMQ